jgi:hypothetical protein
MQTMAKRKKERKKEKEVGLYECCCFSKRDLMKSSQKNHVSVPKIGNLNANKMFQLCECT